MACPFFFPTHRHERELWNFRARLPLGDGWAGKCGAPGQDGVVPADEELRDHCNLGYAHACARLPRERAADAVRFSVAADIAGVISIGYAMERDHAPAGNGRLDFECATARWTQPHPDPRVQAMAQAYLQSYFARRPRSAAARVL